MKITSIRYIEKKGEIFITVDITPDSEFIFKIDNINSQQELFNQLQIKVNSILDKQQVIKNNKEKYNNLDLASLTDTTIE